MRRMGLALGVLGLVCAAWVAGFQKVGWGTLSILAVLMVLTFVVDFLASRWGAKRVGASWLALLGAFLGTIAGFFFSLPGIIFGPFLGFPGQRSSVVWITDHAQPLGAGPTAPGPTTTPGPVI